MVTIEGEFLDGYHVEYVPQLNTDDVVDMNALSTLAGMRAVWLLYFLGKWDHLEDLGVDREQVEPILKKFNYGKRLTIRQAQQLQKKVPALVAASKELRLAYALKQLDKPKKRKTIMAQDNEMLIYHAEVDSVLEAEDKKQIHQAEILAAKGTIEVGRGVGQSGAIIMVQLPARLNVDAANVLANSGLKFSKVRAAVIAVPKDQGVDPRPKNEMESEDPRLLGDEGEYYG